MQRHSPRLELLAVNVPEAAVEAYEAALGAVCASVGFFRDDAGETWRVEGVKEVGKAEGALAAALAIAERMSGFSASVERCETPAEGWLRRIEAGFPEQYIGRRFAVRGTHVVGRCAPGRITLTLDAGLAFGSGEHGSTRGCLRALEAIAYRRARRVLDLGTGTGILAMAAARLLRCPVLGTDVEPWAIRVAEENVRLNRLSRLVRLYLADGWQSREVRSNGPFDLVFANILARPLCAMARELAVNLAPGGTAVLSGVHADQARWVLAAHRRCGLRLERLIGEGVWTTLVLRR